MNAHPFKSYAHRTAQNNLECQRNHFIPLLLEVQVGAAVIFFFSPSTHHAHKNQPTQHITIRAKLWHCGSPSIVYCSTRIWRLFEIALVLSHLTIVRDSPRVVDVARAPGCVEELDFLRAFLRAMLLHRGRISFILREQNFGTAVLRQLLLQHTHLTIVRDSPCVAAVARAPGCVEELDFLRVMLLQRGRISFILRELNFGTAVLRQLLLR